MFRFQDRISEVIKKINERFKLDVSILIILCIVAQHSFLIKFLGIVFVTFLNAASFREFSLKKIPAFYFIIFSTEILKFIFLNESYGLAHLSQFSVGLTYWAASGALCWILFYTVSNGKYIKESIQIFTILNFTFSIYQYTQICIAEHVINPYNTGHNHPYGISSGDLINGLLQGVHLTNAFISLFLFIFFVHENRPLYVFFALIPLLLTGSNYATIILFIANGILFFTTEGAKRRWLIIAGSFFIVIFYWLLTPLNAEYMLRKTLHISATLPNSSRDLQDETKGSARGFKEVLVADTNMPYDIAGTTAKRMTVRANESIFNFVKQPGKARSYYQTKNFMLSSVPHFLFGTGMGGFSSKLAFNSSGVMDGSSLNKYLPVYETSYFKNNHKAIYSFLKTQHIMFHSESNRPFSVYNQLLGEYGFFGIVVFVIAYLWYFLKRIRKRTYALPIFVAILFIFNIDYFIESLSVLLFFELLLFLDIKQNSISGNKV